MHGSDADSDVAEFFFNEQTTGLGSKKVFSQNREVKVKARDYVGNYSNELSIFITKIDKSISKVTAVSGNATEWTNQDVVLNVDEYFCGDSGLDVYIFNGMPKTESSKTFSVNNTVNITV